MEEDDGVEGDDVEGGLSEQERSECESDENGAAGDSDDGGGEDVSLFITFSSLTSLA